MRHFEAKGAQSSFLTSPLTLVFVWDARSSVKWTLLQKASNICITNKYFYYLKESQLFSFCIIHSNVLNISQWYLEKGTINRFALISALVSKCTITNFQSCLQSENYALVNERNNRSTVFSFIDTK